MNLAGRTLLVIDDTPSIRTFLRISLQSQGVHFSEAATATEGVSKCRELRPDIVVLDLGLPDRDGLDILPEIAQGDGDGYKPVVIILSVRKEQRTKDIAFELGATGYVTKPFIMDDLLDVIHEQLKTPA